MPTRQGFDEFFGIPYSDDMTKDKQPESWPELPLMRNEQVIEAPADRDRLVGRCTREAIAFIKRNRERPFFVYLPQPMPGSTPTPFSSPAFRGHRANGRYGDAVEELDWAEGEIHAVLQRLDLAGNTLVIWTADNGEVLRNPPQGCCAVSRLGLRHVRRRHADAVHHALARQSSSRPDLRPALHDDGPAAHVCRIGRRRLFEQAHRRARHSTNGFRRIGRRSPWDAAGFGYYRMDQLQAIRSGPWKLYLPLERKLVNAPGKTAAARAELFDVVADVGEAHEVAVEHPGIVQRLLSLAANIRREIGNTGFAWLRALAQPVGSRTRSRCCHRLSVDRAAVPSSGGCAATFSRREKGFTRAHRCWGCLAALTARPRAA